MEERTSKRVDDKWGTDGYSVIYKLDDILLFYNIDNDPKFYRGQEIYLDDALDTRPYKAIKFDWESIPSDSFRMLVF